MRCGHPNRLHLFTRAFRVALAVGWSLAPLRAAAQDVAAQLDSLASPSLVTRASAVFRLAPAAADIPAGGRSRLIDLLQAELTGTMPIPAEEADRELFSEYIARLTNLIARFNDPRATPLLARQGIAFSNGSVFQVAAAGDAGIGPLVVSWNENEALRPAVVRTMGQMRYYADSTGRALAPSTVVAIDDHLLRAYAAPEPWVRHAFVDAVEAVRDPGYLPLIQRLRSGDPAQLDGVRYVARDAGAIEPVLDALRTASSPGTLLASLGRQLEASCRVAWITDGGICQSLRSKLQAASAALARGESGTAANQLGALTNELNAQRGKSVNESAYALLGEAASYLVSRL
jgi:hypothetical protein